MCTLVLCVNMYSEGLTEPIPSVPSSLLPPTPSLTPPLVVQVMFLDSDPVYPLCLLSVRRVLGADYIKLQ